MKVLGLLKIHKSAYSLVYYELNTLLPLVNYLRRPRKNIVISHFNNSCFKSCWTEGLLLRVVFGFLRIFNDMWFLFTRPLFFNPFGIHQRLNIVLHFCIFCLQKQVNCSYGASHINLLLTYTEHSAGSRALIAIINGIFAFTKSQPRKTFSIVHMTSVAQMKWQ